MTNHCRYCLEHQNLEGVCAVEGCSQAVTSDPKTGKLQKACNDPIHVKMEAANTESSRSGKSRTQRNKIAKLNDAMESSMHDLIDEVESIPLQDTDEWYKHEIATGAVRLVQVLRSYSRGNRSKGLWPQLVRCAPFLSIAPYFRMLYVLCPKIRMAVVVYPKVWTTIVWYLGIEGSSVFLSEDKE
jgi:hypothetical protein